MWCASWKSVFIRILQGFSVHPNQGRYLTRDPASFERSIDSVVAKISALHPRIPTGFKPVKSTLARKHSGLILPVETNTAGYGAYIRRQQWLVWFLV